MLDLQIQTVMFLEWCSGLYNSRNSWRLVLERELTIPVERMTIKGDGMVGIGITGNTTSC